MNDIVGNNLEFPHSFLLSSLSFINLTVLTYTIAGFLANLHKSPLNKVRFGPGIFKFIYYHKINGLELMSGLFIYIFCVVERVMFVEVAKCEAVRRTKNDKWKFKEHVFK